jgi:hypothetical protein
MILDINLRWIMCEVDVSALPTMTQYGSDTSFYFRNEGQLAVQPTRAEVTFFLNGEEPSVTMYGRRIKKNGELDKRFNTDVMIIGHLHLREIIADEAEQILIETMAVK